ncbi:MAG: AAA family ATPase [Bacteroidetes bacterium]|nr:AAA family ATPase [Bacteroidota bacterium]
MSTIINPDFSDLNNPDTILNHFEELRQEFEHWKQDSDINIFSPLKTANKTIEEANKEPDPEYLYPTLLIENEFTILFADTGIGKTVFATQIGNYIAERGRNVLLLDLELSKKQFEKRYKDENGKLYKFSDNFFRIDFERLKEVPKDISYLDFFIKSLTKRIDDGNISVVILDNLTKLSAGSTDNAKDTIPVIEALNKLKFEKDLTILALEHNKKVTPNKPIELNDLQGSKMKSNLCDSVFTIGRHSTDKYLRYIKQVKVRSAELICDTENVLKCEILSENGFLHLKEIGYGSEWDFIKEPTENNKSDLIMQVKELSQSGHSQRQISKDLGISLGAVNKYLKK